MEAVWTYSEGKLPPDLTENCLLHNYERRLIKRRFEKYV